MPVERSASSSRLREIQVRARQRAVVGGGGAPLLDDLRGDAAGTPRADDLPRAARAPTLASLSRAALPQSETNKNVSWLRGAAVWPTYLGLLGLFRFLLWVLALALPGFSPEAQWTVTSVAHGVFSFLAFHFNRGTPLWEDQNEFIDQTVWEQIDAGVPWTDTRKFLIVVPILLFLVVSHCTDYAVVDLAINLPVLVVLLVSKLPEMHGVRIFGINKGIID